MHWPIVIACAPVVAVGILVPKATVILVALAAIAALTTAFKQQAILLFLKESLLKPLPLTLLLFTGFAALSSLWALSPTSTLEKAGTLAALVIALSFVAQSVSRVSEVAHDRIAFWLVTGYAVGLLFVAIELNFRSPIRALIEERPGDTALLLTWWVNRGITIVCLICWPIWLLAWQWRGAWLAVLLALATFLVVSGGPQRAAMVALPLGAFAMLLTWLLRHYAVYLAGAVMAAAILTAPIWQNHLPAADDLQARYPNLFYSAIHRLHIWEFTAKKIAKKPLIGWGLRSARDLPGAENRIPNAPGPARNLSLHPHNASLQIWLELGLVGALLIAAIAVLVAAFLLRLRNRPLERSFGVALLASAFCFLNISYGVWQSWWIAALGISAVLFRFAMTYKTADRVQHI